MMSGAATSELQTRCQQAGLSLCIAKPLRRAELLALVGSLKEEPMVSALMHDGDMAEMIDEFVASVRTRLDELQTALKASDTALLTRLVRMLKSQAGTCGFDVIAHAAGELEMLAVEGAEAARLAGKLRDLGRLCGSARAANRDQAAKNTGQCGANVS
jgi:HPt (histidine-containing phosphotransfer) domain-containing protein